jgi:hypothetical protein
MILDIDSSDRDCCLRGREFVTSHSPHKFLYISIPKPGVLDKLIFAPNRLIDSFQRYDISLTIRVLNGRLRLKILNSSALRPTSWNSNFLIQFPFFRTDVIAQVRSLTIAMLYISDHCFRPFLVQCGRMHV